MGKKSELKKHIEMIRRAPTKIIPLSKIIPAPYNPRKELGPGDRVYDDLKRNIYDS